MATGFTHPSKVVYGYVVIDPREKHHVVHHYTLASNRKDAWNKFCHPAQRPQWKKRGFICVFTTVEFHLSIPERNS